MEFKNANFKDARDSTAAAASEVCVFHHITRVRSNREGRGAVIFLFFFLREAHVEMVNGNHPEKLRWRKSALFELEIHLQMVVFPLSC